MGSARKSRGRLPRRVYWVRRGIVLGVALLLVFGIGRLLGGTGSDNPGTATIASNQSSPRSSSAGITTLGPVAPSGDLRTKAAAPLLAPNGDCLDDDVSALPSVPRAWVGTPVVIELQLQGTQPACTFKVSPETLVVKIASGKDRIWSSQDCPRSVPTSEVVVRSGQPVQVPVTWSGRRSDDTCSKAPAWAMPGFYHVYAAALGSAANDVQFEITRAAPKTVTRTPRPRPSASTSVAAQPSTTAKSRPRSKPTTSPTATAGGKGTKCGGDNAAGSC